MGRKKGMIIKQPLNEGRSYWLRNGESPKDTRLKIKEQNKIFREYIKNGHKQSQFFIECIKANKKHLKNLRNAQWRHYNPQKKYDENQITQQKLATKEDLKAKNKKTYIKIHQTFC